MKVFGKITPAFFKKRYFQADCEEKMNESQTGEKLSVFRDSSQFITQLSASLRGRRCIFKQVKTEQEAHNERFFSAD
jgi:hypothetical protein